MIYAAEKCYLPPPLSPCSFLCIQTVYSHVRQREENNVSQSHQSHRGTLNHRNLKILRKRWSSCCSRRLILCTASKRFRARFVCPFRGFANSFCVQLRSERRIVVLVFYSRQKPWQKSPTSCWQIGQVGSLLRKFQKSEMERRNIRFTRRTNWK